MNWKRLLAAILAAFATVWVTDFLIHGLWLQADYQASAELWRPEAEMVSHMGWLLAGQLLAAAAFVTLWARGFAEKACPRCAVRYGLCMALFLQANTLITYAVQPLPGTIAVKWFLSSLAQGVVVGLVVYGVYRPKVAASAVAE